MYRTSWLALSAALGTLLPAYAIAQDASPRIELQLDGADELGAAGGLFVPFVLGDGTVVFADGWLDYDADGQLAGSIGGGVRQQVGDWVLGGNASLDFLRSANGFNYQQIAAGLEALGSDWEFRLNGALPVGTNANEVDANSRAAIDNGNFVINQGYEVALYSADAEVGFRLPVFEADSATSWKIFAGAFARGSELSGTTTGVSLRTELKLALDDTIPGASLAFGGGVNYDSNQRLDGRAYVRFSMPLGGTSSSSGSTGNDPLFQRVERNRVVNTIGGAFGANQAAIASTGSGAVVQIDGTDTTDLNNRIAAAGDGAIVLASGNIQVDETLILLANQMLVGGGGVVKVSAGGKTVDYVNPGARTVISNGNNNLRMALLSTPTAVDVIKLADGTTVSTLSIVGGVNGIVGKDVSNVTIDNVEISGVSGNGIVLTNVENAVISNSTIRDLPLCTSSTNCEFSVFNPDWVPNAAINATGVRGLEISGVTISDVTYGIFVSLQYEDTSWPDTLESTSDISIKNVNVTNSLREGLLVVNAQNVDIDNLHIDNSALERSMDLLVLMSSQNVTLTNSSLKGGINGLMFAHSSLTNGDNPENVTVSNVQISGASRSGIFMNPAYSIDFKNVTIDDVGHYGIYFYGDSWGYQGGAVRDITFDNVSISNAAEAGIYISGPIEDIDGDIAFDGKSPIFELDGSSLSSAEVIQNGSQVFSICGQVVTTGATPASCN